MMRGCLAICFLNSAILGTFALHVAEREISGTECVEKSLTPKQLAIQRWFAQLTFLQSQTIWDGWGDALNDLDCDGNTCIRYEISGLAYAAAVLGSKTPAYTALSEAILYDAIQRMIQKPVWQYIELFGDFQEQPTYPDPVAYKNIMYSGHLAQMISLFEALTGNMTFSTHGWEFDWGTDTAYPEPIPYSSQKLLQAIYDQTNIYEGALGGVPCEPDSIFVICNNYPMNAFLQYDILHGTSFAPRATEDWQGTVQNKGVNRVPPVPGMDNNYFNLDYLIHPLGIWEPIASVGSDAWALAWMNTWWNATTTTTTSATTSTTSVATASTTALPTDAYHALLNSSCWVTTPVAPTVVPAIADKEVTRQMVPDLRQSYLKPGDRGNKIFPFTPEITTSFFPMIYKQLDDAQSSGGSGVGRSDGRLQPAHNATERLQEVYRYFEHSYGRFFDSDGDNISDSYQYNTALPACTASGGKEECETGDYSVWATANLVLGMVLPEPSVNPHYLRDLIRGVPRFQQSMHEPKVEAVDYPHVMVSSAWFEQQNSTTTTTTTTTTAHTSTVDSSCMCPTPGVLHLTLLPGDLAPTDPHSVLLSAGCMAADRQAEGTLSPCRQNADAVSAFLHKCTSVTLNGRPYPQALLAPTTDSLEGWFTMQAPGWRTEQQEVNFAWEFEVAMCV